MTANRSSATGIDSERSGVEPVPRLVITPRDLVDLTVEIINRGSYVEDDGDLAIGILRLVQYRKRTISKDDIEFVFSSTPVLFSAFFRWNRRDVAPVAVWTSGNEQDGKAIRAAVGLAVSAYGLLLEKVQVEQKGSWWQRLKLTAAKLLSREEVQQRLSEMELGLKAALVDRQISENDERKANALGAILDSLSSVDEAVVVVGQIVVVKSVGQVVARTVDAQRAAHIERSDFLLSDPKAVLQVISNPLQIDGVEEPTAPTAQQEIAGRS